VRPAPGAFERHALGNRKHAFHRVDAFGQLHQLAFRRRGVERRLNGLGVVGRAIAPGAELARVAFGHRRREREHGG
jgi:hypothetical protein